MKKIIFTTLLTFICSSSFSEEILLNCKFNKLINYNHKTGETFDLTEQFINKEKDIIIQVDTNKYQLIMNDREVYNNEVNGYGDYKVRNSINISANTITWNTYNFKMNWNDVSYNLNRLTGVLDKSVGAVGYVQEKYICSQMNKKF
jgi:hypothetical protein